ncbi:PfkB family carbohydrate kinase [Horticoccus sp. 23ND18S-11]|uniref:PfkB family carbohydrate kinase n=1 Tax=Horticoccus sp. 23ND18S-11 TaxID=3391832 RepID=UPI0039C8C2EF
MPRASSAPAAIVCFGEALWDILPRGIFLGGAPLNVAYHLSRHGADVIPISAVGRDFLGDEAIRRIAAWKIPTTHLQRHRTLPTGTVHAKVDSHGAASYTITRSVSWDSIAFPRSLNARVVPAAIVYGSLALRGPSNRRTLQRLFAAWPDAVRVLDVNLRQPFDRGPGLRLALDSAQLLKLNHEELARLTSQPIKDVAAIEAAARRLAQSRHLQGVCVTAGARGAGLWWKGQWFWEQGRPVAVKDTIGAGDAFLGALLANLMVRSDSPAKALAQACRMGEFVAARDGATPPYRCNTRGEPHDTSR